MCVCMYCVPLYASGDAAVRASSAPAQPRSNEHNDPIALFRYEQLNPGTLTDLSVFAFQ